MNLTDAELDRYARHIVLPQVGGFGQRRLKETRVVVVGAGGIGSAVIPSLAGAGIGQLTIIDDDVVELFHQNKRGLVASPRFLVLRRCQVRRLALACSTMPLKAALSKTARSASTLRSMSIAAFFRPAMNWL